MEVNEELKKMMENAENRQMDFNVQHSRHFQWLLYFIKDVLDSNFDGVTASKNTLVLGIQLSYDSVVNFFKALKEMLSPDVTNPVSINSVLKHPAAIEFRETFELAVTQFSNSEEIWKYLYSMMQRSAVYSLMYDRLTKAIDDMDVLPNMLGRVRNYKTFREYVYLVYWNYIETISWRKEVIPYFYELDTQEKFFEFKRFDFKDAEKIPFPHPFAFVATDSVYRRFVARRVAGVYLKALEDTIVKLNIDNIVLARDAEGKPTHIELRPGAQEIVLIGSGGIGGNLWPDPKTVLYGYFEELDEEILGISTSNDILKDVEQWTLGTYGYRWGVQYKDRSIPMASNISGLQYWLLFRQALEEEEETAEELTMLPSESEFGSPRKFFFE